MPKSSIQFHASPEELLQLVAWIAERFAPEIRCTAFPPLERFSISASALEQTFLNPRLASCTFILGPIDPTQPPSTEDMISLVISRPREGQLRQSAIGVQTSKDATLLAWKEVAKYVRAFTESGVRVTNPSTGESAMSKVFRYSAGARALAESGVVMLPTAGTNVVTFEG
jgi:hypothetical protein